MAYRVVAGENCQYLVTPYDQGCMAGWPPCLLSATSLSLSLNKKYTTIIIIIIL